MKIKIMVSDNRGNTMCLAVLVGLGWAISGLSADSFRAETRGDCYQTDLVRTCIEVPVETNADGPVTIRMQPLSFAQIEF